MRLKLDTVVTVTLVLCALVTTGFVIRREFASGLATALQVDQKPVLIEDWRTHLANGIRMGSMDAAVQVIEFADFECPFCSSFHKTLMTLRDRYPDQVAMTFIHFPLSMHRFAESAARVAECAEAQGRFEPMHDVLFDQQDQLGLMPWIDFAKAAGISDINAFDICTKSTAPVARVEAGKALAKRLDIRGTPTLIINGWKLPQPRVASAKMLPNG